MAVSPKTLVPDQNLADNLIKRLDETAHRLINHIWEDKEEVAAIKAAADIMLKLLPYVAVPPGTEKTNVFASPAIQPAYMNGNESED